MTLRDLAETLGLSKATISMALKGNPLIAEQTRDKVVRCANDMGYVYNRRAAGLSTGESRTVGIAVHDITIPYFARVCASIETVLTASDRLGFLVNTNDSLEMQNRFIRACIEHNADGVILCPAAGTTTRDIEPVRKMGLPFVNFVREIKGAECDFVGNDDKRALMLSTGHLISLGHRRIAMLGGGENTSTSFNRRAGFKAAMEKAGYEIPPEYFMDCDSNPESGSEAIQRVMALPGPPTAVVCFTDLIALGVLSGLMEMNLKPGRDMAVMGCDGIPEGGRAYAQLSTVNVQKTAIGKMAAEMICRRIENSGEQFQHVIMEPTLVVRKSCGAAG